MSSARSLLPAAPFPAEPRGAVPADIVFSLTDDQDVELGGWNPMKQTQELLQKSGGLLKNWRIHTPICSPSRSETVSGRYFHNIKSPLPVPPIKLQPAATGHIDGSVYNNQSFAVYLRRDKGYNVGQFGKSNFNTCEGFSRWFQGAFLGYGGGWQDNEAANFSYHGKPTDCAPSTLKESLVRTQPNRPLMCAWSVGRCHSSDWQQEHRVAAPAGDDAAALLPLLRAALPAHPRLPGTPPATMLPYFSHVPLFAQAAANDQQPL